MESHLTDRVDSWLGTARPERNGRGRTDENQGDPSWKKISEVLRVRAR